MTNEEILQQLNEAQRRAVEYCDGPQLVIAGAGSGKTRVLTYKIAYLINLGLAPWCILALTFTNKAANEMKERIATLVGERNARYINMGTFHSIFARILRQEATRLNYTSSFTIYDEADSRNLIKAIITELGLDDDTYKPQKVKAAISKAKNQLLSPSDYERLYGEENRRRHRASLSKIYEIYNQRCLTTNAMDFDDLLVNTYKLFQSYNDVRLYWADRFRYLLVDEYQDTNFVQQRIIEQLTRENQMICAVGDDAQSIYAFRGANMSNMLHFDKDFPKMKEFKLEQNYRSTQMILNAANSVIRHNKQQIEKTIFTESGDGDKVHVRIVNSDFYETDHVVGQIRQLIKYEDYSFSDIAILYRTNAQSRQFEEQLRVFDIPYKIHGGLSFYQRKEVKDVIAYMRMACNPTDDEALKRIINVPARGIGKTSIDKLAIAATENNTNMWTICCDLDSYLPKLNSGAKNKIRAFVEIIQQAIGLVEQGAPATEVTEHLMNASGLRAEIERLDQFDDDQKARYDNFFEIINAVHNFCEMISCEPITDKDDPMLKEYPQLVDGYVPTLPDFLGEIALFTDNPGEDPNTDSVSLMTVHAAKGLEFRAVFIVGMEEGLFPSSMNFKDQNNIEIEEERRLFYVAITRAKEQCFISCARSRFYHGSRTCFDPSRFLDELDKNCLEIQEQSLYFR